MKLCTTVLFFITICLLKSIDCQIICNPNNNLKNDPQILSYLTGVYYKVYTTASFYGNQILKYKTDRANKAIYTHSYDDSGCCKSIYMSTVGQSVDYYSSRLYSDSGCQKTEDIEFKLLFTNGAKLGAGLLGGLLGGLLNALLLENLCVVMWICRASLEGVHVFCRKPTVSSSTVKWIQDIGNRLNVTLHPAVNNHSYLNTPCIADF